MRKIFIILVAMIVGSGSMMAQELSTYKSPDSIKMNAYNRFYVSLYGGVTQFYGDVSSDIYFPGSMMKGKFPWAISPRIGYDFNSRFGVRADLNGSSIWAKSNKPGADIYFHSSIYDIQADMVFNLTNLLFPYRFDKKWSLTAFAGAGFMFYNSIARNSNDSILAVLGYDLNGDKTKRESERVWNAGMSGSYKIAKHLDVSLEVKLINTPSDKIDGVYHVLSEFDNYSTVMLGMNYYFGANDQEWKWNPMEPFFDDILDSIKANTEDIVDLGNQVDGLKKCCEEANPAGTGAEDEDGDGVPNVRDLEPKTPIGALVNWQGRTILPNDPSRTISPDPLDFADDDGDGVANIRDLEPNTPKNALVNWQGRTIPSGGSGSNIGDPTRIGQPTGTTAKVGMYFNSVYFPFDQSYVDQPNYLEILKVVQYLRAHPGTRIKISGNTDIRGTNEYNDGLSDRRVKAVKKILLEDFGFTENIFDEEALGEKVVFSQKTHWVNRRVDFFIVN